MSFLINAISDITEEAKNERIDMVFNWKCKYGCLCSTLHKLSQKTWIYHIYSNRKT